MKIIDGHLYFIKDEFIEKYNQKYHLMENKFEGTKRPTYFCFRDKVNNDILWFVPMSTQYEKYMKIYINKKQKLKGKEPNNFVFANVSGKKNVFLIQNMFPTIEKYIEEEYTRNDKAVVVTERVKTQIMKKATDVLANTAKGKVVTFTNLPEFINDIKRELKV